MVLRVEDLRALWQRAQRLAPRAVGSDPAAIVRSVGAIQSQDPSAAALALRVRGNGFVAAEVEAARVVERSMIRTWCHRGTLHLVPAEDVGWLLRLLGPASLAKREARFRALGLDEDLWVRARRRLRDALADGPLTRAEIGERWAAAGVDASGSRLVHLITRAGLEGEVCDGPDRGRERTWVRLDDWLDVPAGPHVPAGPRSLAGPQGEAALAELARRYLAAHGPADPRDLAAWSGLAVGAARDAWRLIGGELEELATAVGPRWVLASQRTEEALSQPAAAAPVVRLLAAFDAYLLGYHDRELIVPPPHTKAPSGGGLRVLPTVAVDGAVVGTWRLQRRRGSLEITVEPFERLDPSLLSAEVADIGRFLGLPAAVAAHANRGDHADHANRGDHGA